MQQGRVVRNEKDPPDDVCLETYDRELCLGHCGSVRLVAQLLSSWGLLHRYCPPGCLGHAVRHMRSHCAHLLSSSHMEHLVIKEDVWADLLKEGALGCSRKEQGLIRLQAPAAQCLESPGPGTGCTACCHQVGADWALQPQALGIELLLQPTQRLQKALQGAL